MHHAKITFQNIYEYFIKNIYFIVKTINFQCKIKLDLIQNLFGTYLHFKTAYNGIVKNIPLGPIVFN